MYLIRTLFLTILSCISAAPAATISTLGSAHDGYTDATWNIWVGQAFHVTSLSPASFVTSISVPVVVYDPSVNFVVRVVGSLSTNPNAPDMANTRATLFSNGSQLQGTAVQLLELTPKVGEPMQPLEANTRYWIIMGNTAPDYDKVNAAGRYAWSYTNTNAPAAGPADELAILNVVAESGTAGTGWSLFNQSPQRFGISIPPVPEPASASLLLLAAGLITRRSR